MRDLTQKNILKRLINKLYKYEYLVGIILFGSFARGDASKKSDVDVFILLSEKKYKDRIENELLEIKSKRVFQPVVRAIDELEKSDPTFFQNMLREGKVVYWKNMVDVDISEFMRLKPFIMYTFRLDSMKQNTKARFNYELYGKSKNGLLKELNGEFVASSCVLVPSKEKTKIESLFNRYKVKYKFINIWK
ncbi:MAG: nucleotidyltransferase domain-containing protein [Endomicrobiales bacterium]|nr:nucleotidyltransferase domain-containing protein [Endomicrobiales bacterium]